VSGAEVLAHPADQPDSLESTALRLARVSTWVRDVAGDLHRDRDRLGAAWVGPASASCRRELGRAASLAESVADPLAVACSRLRAHAATVVHARSQVDRLRREYDDLVAAHRRETAVGSGPVDIPVLLRHLRIEELRSEQVAALDRLHDRHRALLAQVHQDAAGTARQIVLAVKAVLPASARTRRSSGDRESDVAELLPLLATSRRAAGVDGSPPPAGTPSHLVRLWWSALTTDEQDRMVAVAPVELGRLSGLPVAVRSRANERRLDARIAALGAMPTRDHGDRRKLENCLLVRDQLAGVRSRTDPMTRETLTAHLLVFEPQAYGSHGRVAITVGDLDSAAHVAFLVPGLRSDVRSSLASMTDNATAITSQARRRARTGVATVAWMAYDAPDLSNVGTDRAAAAGADLLAQDVLGVQAAREVQPHLTVVGHSYGSTTTGTALRDHWTGVDDAVFVGSPGPNVERATDLRVPAGHVFVGASSRDPVSYLDLFGADPTHENFGAVRFRAEDPTRNPWRLDIRDHSKYFEPKTESLANIVSIVAGDYRSVLPAAYRDEVWLLPDGMNTDPEVDREPTVIP